MRSEVNKTVRIEIDVCDEVKDESIMENENGNKNESQGDMTVENSTVSDLEIIFNDENDNERPERITETKNKSNNIVDNTDQLEKKQKKIVATTKKQKKRRNSGARKYGPKSTTASTCSNIVYDNSGSITVLPTLSVLKSALLLPPEMR